jgi:hypothetical protein
MAIIAQSFDDDFQEWFTSGAASSVGYVFVVLAVVAIVLYAVGRN